MVDITDYKGDIEYISSRLSSTLIMNKDGVPFYVKSVKPDYIWGYNTLTQKEYELEFDDVNLKSPPLGYFKKGKQSAYVVRKPQRYYKQGLSQNSLQFYGNCSIDFTNQILAKTIVNSFHTPTYALECVLSGEDSSYPFSRNWCVGKPIGKNTCKLFYKFKEVGTITYDTQFNTAVPKLHEPFNYLKEEMQETFYEKQ